MLYSYRNWRRRHTKDGHARKTQLDQYLLSWLKRILHLLSGYTPVRIHAIKHETMYMDNRVLNARSSKIQISRNGTILRKTNRHLLCRSVNEKNIKCHRENNVYVWYLELTIHMQKGDSFMGQRGTCLPFFVKRMRGSPTRCVPSCRV